MAIDAVVRLDRLHCDREVDGSGGSEPYAWTALIAGTLRSFETGEIDVVAPGAFEGARSVIKKGMRDGQQAVMPAVQRRLTHRFADGELGFVAIAVVLLEDDGLPGNGVRSGYRKFLEKLKSELGAFLKEHHAAPDMHDVAELRRAIEPPVRRAIKNALSFGQKVWVALGFHGTDQFMGFDAEFIRVLGPADRQPFTLRFEHTVHIPATVLSPSGGPPVVVVPERDAVWDIYRIEGSFELTATSTSVLRPQPTIPPWPPQPRRPQPRPQPRPPGTHAP